MKPAFPTPNVEDFSKLINEGRHQTASQGMSLREWYAGQALAGLCANPNLIEGVVEFAKTPNQIMKGLSEMAFGIAEKMVENEQ